MNSVLYPLQQAPWLWPRQMQIWLWMCVCGLGFVATCMWLGEGEVAERLHTQQVTYVAQLQDIQALESKLLTTQQDIARIAQTTEQKRDDTLPNVMQHLKASAFSLNLQVPFLAVSKTVDAQHLSFEVHGRYVDVWAWWQQAQRQSSALVLQELGLHPQGDRLQMTGRWLWSPIGSSAHDDKLLPASAPQRGAAHHIGFDQRAWLQAQGAKAQQSPSYATWVMPELRRKPHHLEQFELHHLRYEGMISDASKQQALVRVLDGSVASHSLVLLEQGAYLGKDFGRLLDITPEHLWLREVVRDARGEWVSRWVKLPLGRLLEQTPSAKSAS
jgi:type IV pilus assembly protein PilP